MLTTTAMSLLTVFAQDPGPGISRELARARAQQISDVSYELQLVIEKGSAEVAGQARIRFDLDADTAPTQPVVVDFAGSDLTDIRMNGVDVAPRRIHGHLVLPTAQLVPGTNEVTATFRSPVAPTGTPLSIYRDPVDGAEYLYTLVVPADAHRLFPCFDQPDLRARVTFVLDLPPDWTAVANTPPKAAGGEDRGETRRWTFAATEPLPTYLMAFACGPLDVVECPPPDAPGVDPTSKLRIFVRPSQREHLDVAAVAHLHRTGLEWIATKFGVPYPFGKLDVVLLPGFPYGGMEHAGAIFYRESGLVFDHPPTTAELVRRSTLIYHEVSHQWFGNLVTMKWFDDLWLKEGFATFTAYQALEELEPERRAWLRFLQQVKPRAYAVDATPGTTPVYQELGNLADAKSAYGAIVYNKAPAVLRELHDRLGSDVFFAGLRRYLTEHALGNADWRDLATALEAAARCDLGRWSERWLLAPSMPQVRVELVVSDEGEVTDAALLQRPIGGEGTWPLRLELLLLEADGATRTITLESDRERTPLPVLNDHPAPAAVLANPRDVAYGQFVPDARSRSWLADHAQDIADPLTRAVAMSALFEAVREAELDPAAFAKTALAVLTNEDDPDTHGWLLSRLGTCLYRYLSAARSAPLRERTVDLLLGLLGDGEPSGCELHVFRFLAWNSADERVLALCRLVVQGRARIKGLEVGKQDRFLAAAALIAAGVPALDFNTLQKVYAGDDIGKEVFLAKAASPFARRKAEYWQHYLQRDEPPEQWTQASLSYFHWRGQEALTLPYLKKALEQVDWVKQHRRIFFMPAWLDAFVNGHSSPEALAIVDQFLAATELSEDVRRKLLQSRDGLARAVRIRAQFGADGRR